MDKRIEKTLVKIRKGLLELVPEKDIADISVTELSRAAGIDRKTFYLHYKTVDDALMGLCDFTVQEAASAITGGGRADLVSQIKAFYDYLEAADESLYLLISGEKSRKFRTAFLHGVFTSKAFGRFYTGTDRCLIEGYLYSILYIYEKYRRSGRKIDTGELAQMAADLIEHGVKK